MDRVACRHCGKARDDRDAAVGPRGTPQQLLAAPRSTGVHVDGGAVGGSGLPVAAGVPGRPATPGP
eukprot:8100680-Alexandrium_andersonii.AAC.1